MCLQLCRALCYALFMGHHEIQIPTKGEALYSITDRVREVLPEVLGSERSGVLHLFLLHTSCALAVSEDWDPSARKDVESFLNHLAPRDLPFIQHTLEGADDSPSHMKSVVLHQNLAFLIEKGELVLGTWQGIFLAEFRDHPHTRKVLLKFMPG